MCRFACFVLRQASTSLSVSQCRQFPKPCSTLSRNLRPKSCRMYSLGSITFQGFTRRRRAVTLYVVDLAHLPCDDVQVCDSFTLPMVCVWYLYDSVQRFPSPLVVSCYFSKAKTSRQPTLVCAPGLMKIAAPKCVFVVHVVRRDSSVCCSCYTTYVMSPLKKSPWNWEIH